MKEDDVKCLVFEDVSLEESNGFGFGKLFFSVNKEPYVLVMKKERNKIIPRSIYHGSGMKNCDFCDTTRNKTDICLDGLDLHRDKIYKILREHPSVRIPIIFF